MSATETFTLPKRYLEDARTVIWVWVQMNFSPMNDDGYPLREILDVVETTATLAPLGPLGFPSYRSERVLDARVVAALRKVAEDVKNRGEDMAVSGYDVGTDRGWECAAYEEGLVRAAASILEVLP